MMPDRFAFDLRPEPGCTDGIASEIFTGISVSGESLPNRPFRYCVRHLNTWFAFTPFARATSATDAPGLNVSSTIRRRSSFERNSRWPPFFDRTTLIRFSASTINPPPHRQHADSSKDGGRNSARPDGFHRTLTRQLVRF